MKFYTCPKCNSIDSLPTIINDEIGILTFNCGQCGKWSSPNELLGFLNTATNTHNPMNTQYNYEGLPKFPRKSQDRIKRENHEYHEKDKKDNLIYKVNYHQSNPDTRRLVQQYHKNDQLMC